MTKTRALTDIAQPPITQFFQILPTHHLLGTAQKILGHNTIQKRHNSSEGKNDLDETMDEINQVGHCLYNAG